MRFLIKIIGVVFDELMVELNKTILLLYLVILVVQKHKRKENHNFYIHNQFFGMRYVGY